MHSDLGRPPTGRDLPEARQSLGPHRYVALSKDHSLKVDPAGGSSRRPDFVISREMPGTRPALTCESSPHSRTNPPLALGYRFFKGVARDARQQAKAGV